MSNAWYLIQSDVSIDTYVMPTKKGCIIRVCRCMPKESLNEVMCFAPETELIATSTGTGWAIKIS